MSLQCKAVDQWSLSGSFNSPIIRLKPVNLYEFRSL